MKSTKAYYLFTALITFGMGATVTGYAPFLLDIGLSLGEVALVNGVFWVTVILAEIPTGMVADGRSRAFSLKAGVLFYAVGALVYTGATGIGSAMAGEIIVAFGSAFISGAKQAWIADALHRDSEQSRLGEVYANEAMIRGGASLVGGFTGALLALVSYRLIWTPFIVTGVLAYIVARLYMDGKGEPLERITEIEAFKKSVHLLRNSRMLIWVLFTMIVFGLVVSFNHYWTPYFEPQVGTVGLAFVWVLIYSGLTGSGWLIRKLKIPLGQEGGYIIISLVAAGAGLFLIPLFGGLWFPLVGVLLHEMGRGMNQPLTDTFIQHRVESGYRATFGSVQSFLGRIGFAVVPFIVWMFLEGKPDTLDTIRAVWIINGSLLVTGALLLWVIRPKK